MLLPLKERPVVVGAIDVHRGALAWWVRVQRCRTVKARTGYTLLLLCMGWRAAGSKVPRSSSRAR